MGPKEHYSSTNPARGTDVRKLIRHKETKKFFRTGEWTDDPSLAQSFATVQEAVRAAQFYTLKDVELYQMMLDTISEFDFTVPL
jgi:hypothetical protein